MMTSSHSQLIGHWSTLADQRILALLAEFLPSPNDAPQSFNQAVGYTMALGGKRIRPTLVYLTSHVLGGTIEACDAPALAVELIHTYTLIHDDLPCMDNDDLRRGKPTCHKVFDEATALLAGDALQTLAFEVLSKPDPLLTEAQQIKMIYELARASGMQGLCKGQALDTQATGYALSLEALREIHACKTGALIQASMMMGALTVPTLDAYDLSMIQSFSQDIGLAFQVQDDILDVIGNTELLGKTQGRDAALNKTTYASLLGLDEAKRFAQTLCLRGKEKLQTLKYNVEPLCCLADYIVERVA